MLGLLNRSFKMAICMVATAMLLVSGASADTLRRGNVAEPDTLDPHKMTSVWENVIGRDLFHFVTALDARGRLIPGAAKSWDISEDGKTYTFHLRDGLLWSDGHPMEAEDFASGVRRLLDPMTTAQSAPLMYMIKNAQEVNNGELPTSELGIHATDAKTLVAHLEEPSPSFLRMMGQPRVAPLPRHVYGVHGDSWSRAENIVTNGPYTLSEWRANDYIRATKNKHFYDAENVELEEVVYFPTADYNAAVKIFRAGEIDLNGEFPMEQYEFLKEEYPDSVRLAPSLSVSYIIVNHRRKPFDDLRVRRALSLALDRSIITDRVLGLGEVPAYRFTPTVVTDYVAEDFDYAETSMADRKAEAISLLAEAGFDKSNPLNFEFRIRATANGHKIAVVTRAMWQAIGVKADILSSEFKVHYNEMEQGNFEVGDAGWQSNNDPEYFLYLLRTESTDQNYGNYSSAIFDAKMNEAVLVADKKERYRLMAEAEKIMLEDHALIPLYFSTNRALVGPHVQGFYDNPTNTHPSRFMRFVNPDEPQTASVE